MNTDFNKKALEEAIKANPNAEVIYQTTDGQCFTNKTAATSHSFNLKDRKISETPVAASAPEESAGDDVILGWTKSEWKKAKVAEAKTQVEGGEDLEELKKLQEAGWIDTVGGNEALAARIEALSKPVEETKTGSEETKTGSEEGSNQ